MSLSKPQPVGESSSAPAANMPGGKPQVINPYAKKKSTQSTETSQDLTTSIKANGAPMNSVIKKQSIPQKQEQATTTTGVFSTQGKITPAT